MPSAIGSRYNAGNQKNVKHSFQSYQSVTRRPPMGVCGSINELAIVQICTMPESGRTGERYQVHRSRDMDFVNKRPDRETLKPEGYGETGDRARLVLNLSKEF